jgi:hypothetical protein
LNLFFDGEKTVWNCAASAFLYGVIHKNGKIVSEILRCSFSFVADTTKMSRRHRNGARISRIQVAKFESTVAHFFNCSISQSNSYSSPMPTDSFDSFSYSDDFHQQTKDIPGTCGSKCKNVNWAINRHTCPDCGTAIHPICCEEFGVENGENEYQCIPCYTPKVNWSQPPNTLLIVILQLPTLLNLCLIRYKRIYFSSIWGLLRLTRLRITSVSSHPIQRYAN